MPRRQPPSLVCSLVYILEEVVHAVPHVHNWQFAILVRRGTDPAELDAKVRKRDQRGKT